MTRQIKGFITCDAYINNSVNVVSPLYELSDIGHTYAKNKQQYYSTEHPIYSLYVFKELENSGLTQLEVNAIIKVVKEFTAFITDNTVSSKQQLIINFMNNLNTLNPTLLLQNLEVSALIEVPDTRGPDFLSFKVLDIECNIWCSDLCFRGFYPDYEIDVIYPFSNFATIVSNSSAMMGAIGNFNLVEFNTRIEETKLNKPTTHTRILNIPYRLPTTVNSTSVTLKNCYFAFNHYGNQGNYDFVMKFKLYEYLLSLGLTSEYIELIFPSILQINEFFITPRWERYSIPSHVGVNGIQSQITRAYTEDFDLLKYLKMFSDTAYLKTNTYNVPYDYNNILLTVSDGFYTETDVRKFNVVYKDIIAVNSLHPDFSRMETKTQKFLVLLEHMLYIADSNSSNEMFTKMMADTNYVFMVLKRQDVWYLSFFFDGHQYYVIPKYEYKAKS